MARRFFSGNAVATTLVGAIGPTDTSFTLSSTTGHPAGSYVLTLDQGSGVEEKILVVTRSGSTVTVATRAFDGTVAASHSGGASAKHTISATDLDEANAHVNSSTAVHGIAGTVVGTTDTQTLANKILTAPAITNPTVNGTLVTGSLVDTSATQTLANKTLTSPVLQSPFTLTSQTTAATAGAVTNYLTLTVNGVAVKIALLLP